MADHPPVDTADNNILTPDEAVQFAIDLIKADAHEPAETILTKILEIEPDHPFATMFLGICLHQTGRRDRAMDLMRRATDLAPNEPNVWTNFGNMHVEVGDADGAIVAYRRALAIDCGHWLAYSNVGAVLRTTGELELAEEALLNALKLREDYGAAWHNLANVYLNMGRKKDAIRCGMRAVTLAPEGRAERRLLGIAYATLGEMDNARRVFEEWLELDPGNPFAEHYLASFKDEIPDRASDDFVEQTFDSFAKSFEARLKTLDYRAPEFVSETVRDRFAGHTDLDIIDAGCGTGWCASALRPFARSLIGVDLSAKMLLKAKDLGLYDDLIKSELVQYFSNLNDVADLIVVCDTLCYFGKIDDFLAGAARTLRPGGVVVATFEAHSDDSVPFKLPHTGRYTHAGAYVDSALAAAGFTLEQRERNVLRYEQDEPVYGWIVTAHRTA